MLPTREGWWLIYLATGIGVIVCLVVGFIGLVMK
jgi:preprotein translocase subunit Sss1